MSFLWFDLATTTRARSSTNMPAETDFDRFFVAHYHRLVRSLTAITGDPDVAVDAVQEAFIKAYSRWSSIRRYDDPALWVRRVAINRSRDTFRSSRRRRNREDRFVTAPPEARSDSDGVAASLDMASILAGLSPRQRTVATLFYLDDLSIGQIAATLELSDGAVKFHLSKARESLRDALARPDTND